VFPAPLREVKALRGLARTPEAAPKVWPLIALRGNGFRRSQTTLASAQRTLNWKGKGKCDSQCHEREGWEGAVRGFDGSARSNTQSKRSGVRTIALTPSYLQAERQRLPLQAAESLPTLRCVFWPPDAALGFASPTRVANGPLCKRSCPTALSRLCANEP
jgi:hypothetical protein